MAEVQHWVRQKAAVAVADDAINIILECHGSEEHGVRLGSSFWSISEFTIALQQFVPGAQGQ